MNIVFTGPCELFTRREFEDLLDGNSIQMQKAITKKTDLLITNDINSSTTKAQKARKMGIRIIEYKEFLYEYIPEYLI